MAPDLDCISPALCMEGYLKKPKKWSKRYFVIRERPTPCLEYYDSHRRKSSGKPKKVVRLSNAWNIGKKVSGKQKHLIGIYTEKEYFCMAAENETSQTNWVNALRQAVMCDRGIPSSSPVMYKHIWQGNVDTKDLKDCDPQKKINLQGPHRCCVTDKTMVFVPIDSYGGCNVEARNYVEITIATIRSYGHKENVFVMEPGRSSGIGVGQLKFELDDNAIAENMHKTILRDVWNPSKAPDDSRPRSYTHGSSSGRQGNNHRSRQNYCPPPRQVGLGKQSVSNGPKHSMMEADNRARWAKFLPDDSRLRACSEGEAALKKLQYPSTRNSSAGESDMRRWRSFHPAQRNGSISPHAKFRLTGQFHPASSAPHSRTSSLPGSIPSSKNSSAEHIAMNSVDPVLGDGQSSGDEYVDTSIPPPPDVPATPPANLPLQQNTRPCHSRSHSLDGNSSISASPLSTSPYTGNDMSAGTSPSLDGSFPAGSSPSKDFNGRSSIALLSSDYTPMSFSDHIQDTASDYTLMTPGKGVAVSEDGCGYVPMFPLQRSQPQEILNSRPPISDNKLFPGTYSPASPNRSPDKHHHNRRNLTNGSCERIYPHNFQNHCGSSPSSLTQKSAQTHQITCHGLKESTTNRDVPCDFNRSGLMSKPFTNEPMVYSNHYAFMGMGDCQPWSSNESSSNKSPTMEHEYLPMSPMTAGSFKNVVVGNVIAIAESSSVKSNVSQVHSRRYPHEMLSTSDRVTPPRRRYTVSSGISLHWPRNSRAYKHGRRGSTRHDSKSSDSPPMSPGGEYVSIDYERAKQQVGPEYVSLTEPEADDEWSHSEDSNQMTKITHDSNRNILPSVESSTKDENQYPK